MCINLRMTAVIITFLAFPFFAKRWANLLIIGLNLMAVIAGQYKAPLTVVLPILETFTLRRTELPEE